MARVALIVVVAWSALIGAAAGASARAADEAPRDYIVVMRAPGDLAAGAAAIRGEGGAVRRAYRSALNGYAATMSPRAARRLDADPRVAAVSPDTVLGIGGEPTEQAGAVWGLDRIDQRARPLNGVYGYATSGAGVRAYVVDTGVRATHTEFAGRVAPGMTAIADGRGTADCHGHGTHVAGTVAGTVYGVAKSATIVPVRVLGCDGSGSSSGVVAGLDWIAANHPPGTPGVANLSLGGGANPVLDQAVRNLSAAGVTVVVAAGNDDRDACLDSPGRVAEAITVGASTSSDQRSGFSNRGACVDLFAPGSSIRAAHGSGDSATADMSGTSMAAPHVAGAAARALSRSPGATPAQVQTALLAEATPGALTGVGAGSPNLLLHADPLAGALITTIGARPAALVNSSSATVEFSAGVPATFECRLDDAPYAPCSSPHALGGLADGPRTFRVRAIDGEGNVEATPARITFTVDTVAPVTTIAARPARDGAVSVTFAASETATYACRLDGTPFAPCASPRTFTGLAEGGHVVEVRATDAAGNVEDPPARHAFTVAAPAPAPGTPIDPVDPPGSPPVVPSPGAPSTLRIESLRVSPLRLSHGRSRRSLTGLSVAAGLNRSARIDAVLGRRIAGVRRGERCVPSAPRAGRGGARRCVLLAPVGAVSGAGEPGVSALDLVLPRRGPRALRPGRYRLVVTASTAGTPPATRVVSFVVGRGAARL